jgi:uncharacterized protein YfaS (alpha-2-macroglobulin family)
MFPSLRQISFVAVALFFLNNYSYAGGTGAFEGIVKDHRGKPIMGAEVRVQNNKEIIIARGKTDANGHYITSSLPPGVYKVDLVIDFVTKSSLPSMKTKSDGATQLNFALKPQPAKTERPGRRTGSNLW